MSTITYQVPNISCIHCIHTIKTEMGDVPGVKSVDASLDTKRVTIQYEAPATPEKLEGMMAEINYPVEK